MKKKTIFFWIIFIIMLFIIFLFEPTAYAGTQKLKNLDYDVVLNEDGTVDVIETWDIRVSETNTLFKTFELDKTKYGEITNVSVSEITKTGEEVKFIDTNKYAYHVEKGGFYALNRSIKEFEIAWGVSINDTENKVYKIKYKVKDAIKTYKDCSEFYWQFIGTTNSVPADNVKGIIRLPKTVDKRENLRVWAHGPLNGNIEILDNGTVSFEVSKLSTETMVEVRVVTLENLFLENNNVIAINKLENIMSEETKWADEANAKRNNINILIATVVIVRNYNCPIFYIKNYKICKRVVKNQ